MKEGVRDVELMNVPLAILRNLFIWSNHLGFTIPLIQITFVKFKDIELMNAPLARDYNREKKADGHNFDDRAEGVNIVQSIFLMVALGY